MPPVEAIAESFLTLFKAMPQPEKEAILFRLMEDEDIREEIIDLAIIADRQEEPARSFRDFLAERGNA